MYPSRVLVKEMRGSFVVASGVWSHCRARSYFAQKRDRQGLLTPSRRLILDACHFEAPAVIHGRRGEGAGVG